VESSDTWCKLVRIRLSSGCDNLTFSFVVCRCATELDVVYHPNDDAIDALLRLVRTIQGKFECDFNLLACVLFGETPLAYGIIEGVS
jgi:hypothetical protein